MPNESKSFKEIRRIARQGNPSPVKAHNFWKVSDETKVLQLIEKIITPLEKIIYLYIPTQYYNYIPGTEEDCWFFMGEKIEEVYCNLNSLVFLNDSEYERVLKIIDTVHAFVRGYSVADSIMDKRWFELNPNLNYYRCTFDVNDMEYWKKDDFERAQHLPFSYMPKNIEEVRKREAYLEYLHSYSNVRNFKWDKYDTSSYAPEDPEGIMFMHEVAYTLRLVFIDAFPELCVDNG